MKPRIYKLNGRWHVTCRAIDAADPVAWAAWTLACEFMIKANRSVS